MSDPRYAIIQGDAVMDKRLTEIHLRVLLVLGRHTNKRGWAEVSQTKMAKNLGYSRQRINIAFRDLTQWAYIEKRDQFDPQNRGRKLSRYRVCMDRDAQDVADPLSPVGDTPCHLQTLQPPVTSEGDNITTQDLTIEKKQTKKAHSIEFAEFWAQYPRKVAKPTAERAYLKALKSYDHTEIMAGTLRQAAAWEHNGTEKQFIPHPATFLNKERFNDEPEFHGPSGNPAGNGTSGLIASLQDRGLLTNGFDFGTGESESGAHERGSVELDYPDEGVWPAQGVGR